MFDDRVSFLSRPYLQSMLDYEFREYLADGRDNEVLGRLRTWHGRNQQLTETQIEASFIGVFFEGLWGHAQSGSGKPEDQTIVAKYAVKGAGGSGRAGAADLALGWFGGSSEAVPQVLCEFKDVRSGLDAKQNRKGVNQTPVEQCLNYLRHARRDTWGNEPVQPWWALVTDMNEFRLYWWDRAPQAYMRFVVSGKRDILEPYDLLSETEDAKFDRFLFWRLLRRDMLIAQSGKPALWRLVERQGQREIEIEEEFYEHYKNVRERLFNVLRTHNHGFSGTPTELLRVSQKLLDRFIFAFYCEDMGQRMLFPPQFVRDYLQNRSTEAYYDAAGTEIWQFFRTFFQRMNTGGRLGQQQVPHINGGLFADDPLLDSLHIPNEVFAAAGQGANDASIDKDRQTLYYLSARYNYAAKGDAKHSLTLYTLGRIFEQSITELEYRQGEIENRKSIAELSKRKRDGVYYTPEWVVNYLVDETMGPWFASARVAAGWDEQQAEPSNEALLAYQARLRTIKIVDPACGSGAFLISAFRKLLEERKAIAALMQRRVLKDGTGIGDEESRIVADILQQNIFGVDINPASVEIAKLAMWLHSARANSPLSTLDHNILCGNSLVASDCWLMIKRTPEAEAGINPFDWEQAFVEIFQAGGFDIVLGNPPYVKLQNLMKADPDVVAYLKADRPNGAYESTQTGNFDLYLPFIEKGLRLLAPGGRMAYIAPSLWTVNEYGEGLRRLVHRTRQLERWLDFKSFQVFKEAITYTALQFFTKAANPEVEIYLAQDGEIGDVSWSDSECALAFEALSLDEEWLMLAGQERTLVDNLKSVSHRLDTSRVSSAITVGIQTSADHIYHLERLSPGRYLRIADSGVAEEVVIEDGLMRPLISGPQAKRYIRPDTSMYLLFPYAISKKGAIELIQAKAIAEKFPNAWAYLLKMEKQLRQREDSKMDVPDWYAYNYPKNLDKQELPKLIVAQTVPRMRVCADFSGSYYLNNVRVNGILPSTHTDIGFLLATLNGNAVDFVFRRIGKPKQGGWFEANKQFIAPLPVPKATPQQQKEIGAKARRLQDMWTERRDLLDDVEARLSVLPKARYKPKTLWPDLPDLTQLSLPKSLQESEKREWAKAKLQELEEAQIDELQGFLDSGAEFAVEFARGELRLLSGGRPVLHKIYLNDTDGPLIRQYWRFELSKRSKDAARLARTLGAFPKHTETDASRQFMQRVDELLALNGEILAHEKAMNEALYDLYGLSASERQVIEDDCAKRPLI